MRGAIAAILVGTAAVASAQGPTTDNAMPSPTATGSGSGSDAGSGSAAPAAPAPKQTAAIEAPSSQDTVNSLTAGAAPGTRAGLDIGDVRFELHGYARMPLSTTGVRDPYLVDNDYYQSGFAYTRLYEPVWSELYFSAKRGDYKAEFGMFASQFSDYSQASVTTQLGIAQASVTAEHFLGQDPLSVQVGMFWDRFGHIEPYDTYIFGRTHQGGVKVKYKLPGNGVVQAGIGLHEADLQQNQGTTPIAHVAGAYPIGPVEVGAYVLRTWTDDKRLLTPIAPGTMYVAGTDAKYNLPRDLGTAYLALSYYNMDHVLYLAPALEVMHSAGGIGLAQNFLGLDSSQNATGHMYTLATDEKIHVIPHVDVRVFGMGTWVRSPQVDLMDPLHNKDRRLYVKWGVEPSYQIWKKVYAALRFDRVILDVYDSADSFRVLSPRIGFPLENWGELFIQYSHYWYGSRIELRSGQVPGVTMPDSDALKLQAQVVW